MLKRGLCCHPVSVRPSDTLMYSIHTTEDIVKLLSLPGSPITSFSTPGADTQFQGEPLQWGRKVQGGLGKISDFRPKSPFISETVRAEADPGFSNGGHMSRAEGASVEAPQAPRGWNLGRGCPLPIGQGSGEGALPLPRNYFNFLPRNGAFFEHPDTIRQFTRPVAIRLKACKKRRRPCQRQVLVVFH